MTFEAIMKLMRYLTTTAILLVCYLSMQAQSNRITTDPDAAFKEAKEMMQQEKYSLAYPLFKTIGTALSGSAVPYTVQLEASYYAIICGLQLNDQSAVTEAIDFIELEHHAPRIEMMCFHLGNYYFRQSDFASAITYYEQAGVANLSNADIAIMKFQQGYSLFSLQRFAEARPLFDAVRQMPSDKNNAAANYYYGFIAFGDRNYAAALTAFKNIENHPDYKPLVSYYIAEIYYYTGKKDEALAYLENTLQRGNQYYDLSMRQLTGHIYFEKGNYQKALPYLEKYVSSTPKVSRQDLYELSFCYYDAGNYDKSIQGFKELGGKQDTLAQNSMYLLGDAYLKKGNKAGARSAFLFCSLNSSNLAQKEVSKFTYGKLSYELGFTDVALNELKEFSASYPRSVYSNEAKELLVNVLAKTSNYSEALSLFQSIPVRTDMVNRIYPKILYGRAVEYINDQKLVNAEELLDRIFSAAYNAEQLPFAHFWKGELAFRKQEYDSTLIYLQRYLQQPVSYGEVSPTNALYTSGYAALRQQDYTAALRYFERITTQINASSSNIYADAFLRSADCYFMQKKLTTALKMYEQYVVYNLTGSDYAYYQKAVIAGANDQPQLKIQLLQTLQQKYPSSLLAGEANMEVANTWLAMERYNEAIPPLNSIIQLKNQEALKPQAYLKMGISYYNLHDNEQALDYFKQLVKQYPLSMESDEAVVYVKSIFVEKQQPEGYVSFMQQNGKEVSYNEQDSLSFVSAWNVYHTGDADKALSGFVNYMSKFPKGRNYTDAAYLCAEILQQKNQSSDAIPYLVKVADKAPNRYAEAAILQLARIYYFEKTDYALAEQYFTSLKNIATSPENRLESMRGLLRSQYKQKKIAEATPNAQDLLAQKNIATDDKMMANLIIAKNYQLENNYSNAISHYRNVVALGKSEYAAESRYRLAEIAYLQLRYDEAEKLGLEVINKSGSYDFWITKSYILLGDIYFKQKDYFNAEATLKSVVDNAVIEELRDEARIKLQTVIQEKEANSRVEGE